MRMTMSWSRLQVLRRFLSQDACATASISTCQVRHERLRRQAVPLRPRKEAKEWDGPTARSNQFADWQRSRVSGGDGGAGCISLLSAHRKEFAGPDGGDGGNGGHVVFKASKGISDLSHIKSVTAAKAGEKGRNKNMHGKDADHKVVEVPVGTVFRNLEREIVCELTEEGSMFLAAKGGAGGKGNAFFKSSTNPTPRMAEYGGKAEEFVFDIELRSMAHVGFIGFPNAGKSTLLRAISRARPKVAAYPFTTLRPHIGMVRFDDHEQLSIADLPGLIEGAHENKGLGISFLRHVERCLCLIYVVDLAQPDPAAQFEVLKSELEQYSAGLSRRPFAVAANKVDDPAAAENLRPFEEYVLERDGVPVLAVSGKVGTNLRPLLDYMRRMKDESLEREE